MEIDHRAIEVIKLHVDGYEPLQQGAADCVWSEDQDIHLVLMVNIGFKEQNNETN